jgi:hypothetical protein
MNGNTSGNNNTAVGSSALHESKMGSNNTAVGFSALEGTGGQGHGESSNNTAVGYTALQQIDSGANNTAVGTFALQSNTTAGNNTAIGVDALFHNTLGTNNTATGAAALQNNTTASSNTADGAFALFENSTGTKDTAIGLDALENNTSGGSNTAIGYLAGQSLTTGSNNIDIGANVLGKAGEANTIRIGVQGTQKATFIAGISGTAVTGTQVVISSNGRLGAASSSARFKEQIKPMENASEAVLGLKPVTFRYKKEVDPDATPQFGLVAEEVEKVAPDLVIHDEAGKPFTVRYEAVNAMLLNEFLKEHEKVEQLRASDAAQRKQLAGQQKQIKALTAAMRKLSDTVHPVPQ